MTVGEMVNRIVAFKLGDHIFVDLLCTKAEGPRRSHASRFEIERVFPATEELLVKRVTPTRRAPNQITVKFWQVCECE